MKRFDVYPVRLDPIEGSEMRKTRPCVIVSPDALNRHVNTVIIVPLTSSLHPLPYRVRSTFRGRTGQLALDHVRSVSKKRLGRRIGSIDKATGAALLDRLREMFEE